MSHYTQLELFINRRDTKALEEYLKKHPEIELNQTFSSTISEECTLLASMPEDEKSIAVVKILLEHKVSIDLKDRFNTTALMMAAKAGNEKICKLFIEHGANISLYDDHGKTAFTYAAETGHTKICELLLDTKKTRESSLYTLFAKTIASVIFGKTAEYDSAYSTDSLTSALKLAAKNEHTRTCEFLIERGANIDFQDEDGFTMLITAAKKGRLNFCQILVEKGADINLKNKAGRTALYEALANKHSRVGDYLIQQGATVDIQDENGDTELITAAKNGRLKYCQFLVARGANISLTNKAGRTALHEAIANKHSRVGEYLIQQGAVLDLQDENGDTILILAARNGMLNICKHPNVKGTSIKFIENKKKRTALHEAIECKFDILLDYLVAPSLLDEKDENGDTPIMSAARHGMLDTCIRLVDLGADPLVVNSRGSTPLLEAIACGHNHVRDVLVNAPNRLGETALLQAAHQGDLPRCKMLIELGAYTDVIPYYIPLNPLGFAISSKNLDLVKYLAPHFHVNQAFPFSTITPLDHAISCSTPEICASLIHDFGANKDTDLVKSELVVKPRDFTIALAKELANLDETRYKKAKGYEQKRELEPTEKEPSPARKRRKVVN